MPSTQTSLRTGEKKKRSEEHELHYIIVVIVLREFHTNYVLNFGSFAFLYVALIFFFLYFGCILLRNCSKLGPKFVGYIYKKKKKEGNIYIFTN